MNQALEAMARYSRARRAAAEVAPIVNAGIIAGLFAGWRQVAAMLQANQGTTAEQQHRATVQAFYGPIGTKPTRPTTKAAREHRERVRAWNE